MATKSRDLQNPTNISNFLRERTQFIVDPIVNILVIIGIKPNMLTYFGLLIHIPVMYFLAQGRWTAGALMALFGFADAFDGSLARALDSAGESKWGAFLDSTVDRIAEILLFSGFIFYYSATANPFYAMCSVFALGGSLMVSYTRAKAEGLGYQCDVGIFSRIVRYGVFFFLTVFNLPEYALIIIAAGSWITTGQRIHHVWHLGKDPIENPV